MGPMGLDELAPSLWEGYYVSGFPEDDEGNIAINWVSWLESNSNLVSLPHI